jgi:hypothetical protein
MDTRQLLQETIDLFLGYRDRHGYDEERAKVAAVEETFDALTLPQVSRLDDLLHELFSEPFPPPELGGEG